MEPLRWNWKSLGFDPIGTTPEAFARRQKEPISLYWKRMIDDTGIKGGIGGADARAEQDPRRAPGIHLSPRK